MLRPSPLLPLRGHLLLSLASIVSGAAARAGDCVTLRASTTSTGGALNAAVGVHALAARRLRLGGRVVVLAPAHTGLFTEFDRAIGRQRRHDKTSLAAVGPSELRREELYYLDSVGLCASLANRVLLHQSAPSLGHVRSWDRRMVPVSRVLDPLLLRRAGKSIVAVWQR